MGGAFCSRFGPAGDAAGRPRAYLAMSSKRLAPGGGIAMTNDAKLGLVVGIGVVILIAIVFFRKDLGVAHASPPPSPTAQVHSALPQRGDRVDSHQAPATARP